MISTPEQVGFTFMLIKKIKLSLRIIGEGNLSIKMQFKSDDLLKRLM